MNDIRRYYIYSALKKRFSLPVLVYHMSSVGITVEQIALIGAIGYGSQLVLEFPTGALADKIGYRKTLTIAGVLNIVGLALFLGNSFWWFLASAVVYWAGGAFRSGADSALFYERLLYLGREKEHRKILGNVRSTMGIVALSFALLSGLAYQIHWSVPFIISTLMAMVYSYLIVSIGPVHHKPDKTASLRKNMLVALRTIRAHRTLLFVVLFQSIVMGLILSVNEFNSGLLENVGIAAGLVGVIYALRHLTMSVVGQIASRIDRVLSPTLILATIATLAGSLYIGYGLFDSQFATALILVLVALPQTLLQVSYADYIQKLSPSQHRASISSAGSMLASLVLTGGLLIIGFLSRYFELRELLLAAGVIIIVFGILTSLGVDDDQLQT